MCQEEAEAIDRELSEAHAMAMVVTVGFEETVGGREK